MNTGTFESEFTNMNTTSALTIDGNEAISLTGCLEMRPIFGSDLEPIAVEARPQSNIATDACNLTHTLVDHEYLRMCDFAGTDTSRVFIPAVLPDIARRNLSS